MQRLRMGGRLQGAPPILILTCRQRIKVSRRASVHSPLGPACLYHLAPRARPLALLVATARPTGMPGIYCPEHWILTPSRKCE